jgi:hypothetical protein
VVDPSRHADTRNSLESLLRKIPGFKGYLEKEYRRESDELARSLVVAELQKCKTGIDNFQRGQVDAGRLEILPQCERVRSRIDLLQSRLKGAMRGYSGFFDFVQVDEALLDQVYQHDLSLLDDVQGLVSLIEQLATVPDSSATALPKILQQTEQLGRQIDERTKLLEGN